MSHVEPAATGADQGGEGAVVPLDDGAASGDGTTEAQLAVVSNSGDEAAGRREYGDEAENEEEAATVHGSKEGTEELLRKVVCSEEAAYKLYCDYGHRMGFSIRKGKQSYFTGTKRIRTKDYFCSKEGLKEGEKLTDANFNDPHTRTNCKAMVRFRVNDQGEWKVIRLVSDHNHNLARPEERHLLRSARSLIAGRSSSVEAMLYAGYQVQSNPPQLPAGSTSATNNVETLKQDLLVGYGTMAKAPAIGTGDLQSLVSHLKSRANEDGMFYWDVQLDQGGRMTNFFWRDGRSRIDYDYFGDVVVFDLTYRLNKQNVVCAPFVGVNHHWQTTMYGCALLADESMSTFLWLFKSFLESMGNRHPRSIFTNQDQVMSKAIEEVFPNTCHRIAHWHIQKNATSRLGSLNGSKAFNKMFIKCMQGCDSEAEFEETWAEMLRAFKLQDNKWLKKLYKLKQKWCSALNKYIFDGGVEYEPQCDSMSNIFSGIADKLTSLSAIAVAVDKQTEDWRGKEYDEDTRCCQKPPACIIKHSDILNHAAKVYTHRIYKLFETDFLDGCGATKFKELQCEDNNTYQFEMTMQGRGSRVCTVHFNMNMMQITCSCSKFETMGLLCPHALKALSIKNACKIPEIYILKRWTKDAKKWVFNPKQYEPSYQECMDDEAAYCKYVMRYAYDLVIKSQGQEELRKTLWNTLESGEKELETCLGNVSQYAPSYAT
ncbi:protein FAR1-RELATED SEQUENCE 5-like [Phragmites australis]|uniref:protein FAR1-RELATED SEQUENCE 5-like n=1 Tax=Phragmites australis TaxID=29695 RepID=UPI002D799036|nr:protein FAR1-RELATED SEQUENCE 5-like [Phragmites australis]